MVICEDEGVVIILGLPEQSNDDVVGEVGTQRWVREVLEGKLDGRSVKMSRDMGCLVHGRVASWNAR